MNIPTPLRAITLHPWWAYAITHGDKRIEYRTRPLPAHLVDVPIALHAGAEGRNDRYSDSVRVRQARGLGAPIDDWRRAGCPSSAFVAVVTFTGTLQPDDLPQPWRGGGFVGWQIRGVSRLPHWIPATGRQGWWTCTDEQREAIARSLVTP